ncbi:MAG: DegV family EDD domain-containing protein [Actinobacteria bacterium]|nr:DegV family EDD domain-containing protein [Actinomycetota bacterium]
MHIVTVRIVTDSSCDLRGDEVADLNIEVVPLSIRFGDDEYTDREQLSVDRFYELLASSDTLPETAAPSPGRFAESFQRHLDAGATAIVCINISAALSATMQSAVTAADSMDADIRVVDSTSITVGLGSIVIAAAEAATNLQSSVRSRTWRSCTAKPPTSTTSLRSSARSPTSAMLAPRSLGRWSEPTVVLVSSVTRSPFRNSCAASVAASHPIPTISG